MMFKAKPVTFAIGLSLCGISWYLIYRYLKKDEEDDYEDTFVKASKFEVLEIKVPKEYVRELIGRNGRNIKNIQEVSGTKINFKNIEEKNERVCVIRGSIEACHIAKSIIKEFIDSQSVVETKELWIPRMAVGKIIGRGGENITEMQSLSCAKISLISDAGDDEERSDSQAKVVIKGSKEQISIAESLVNEKLAQVKISNSKLEASLAKREPRVPPKPSTNNGSDETSSIHERINRMSPLLSNQESPFEVYVSHMIDPSRFWIQIVGPKATELDQLVEEMTEYYNKPEVKDLHSLESISQGDLVAAVFKYDDKWYRAEVLDVKISETGEVSAEVYYVDYGDTDTVYMPEVYELRTDFLQLHFQAIECFLANVEPVDGKWSELAVDLFEEWTYVAQWKKLSAKINGYCARKKRRTLGREGSPVPGVDLYDYNNAKDVNIAEELVKQGFAVHKGAPSPNSVTSTSVSS